MLLPHEAAAVHGLKWIEAARGAATADEDAAPEAEAPAAPEGEDIGAAAPTDWQEEEEAPEAEAEAQEEEAREEPVIAVSLSSEEEEPPPPPPPRPSSPPPRPQPSSSSSVPPPPAPTPAPESESEDEPPMPPPRPRAPPPQLEVPLPAVPHLTKLPSDIVNQVSSALETIIAERGRLRMEFAMPFKVTLCSSCYRRHWQLHMSLGPNLVHLLPYRNFVTLLVVLANDGEDEDSEQWIREHYGEFLQNGMLVLARAQPTSGYYHASESKNTSHLAAIHGAGGSAPSTHHVLVNLDCDNIMGDAFLKSVIRTFAGTARGAGKLNCDLVAWRGHEGATTGRIAVTADAFTWLRGYDEEGTYGSGGQDVDLIKRAQKAKQFVTKQVKGLRMTVEDSHKEVGYPIPNAANRKDDRNIAKICNCYNPNNFTWGGMNNFNYDLMQGRLREGKLQRNTHKEMLEMLGWPFEILPATQQHTHSLTIHPTPLPNIRH